MMLHFLCGFTGTGKTTYGRRLAEEIGGVFLSVDSWMSALFWMDAPDPMDPAGRSNGSNAVATIWRMTVDIARRGPPCLLEIGFTTQEARNRDGTGQLGFAVTRAMFDYVEAIWEPPGAAELAGYDGVRPTC